jgi:hypothetical protein
MSSASEGIEAAATATLELWLGAYLDDAYRRSLDGTTPPYPRSYQNFDVLERWPEQQMPAVLVAVTDATDTRINGDYYDATYRLEIMLVVAGADYASTRKILRRYQTAVEMCVVQQGDMQGLSQSTKWTGTTTIGAPKRTQMVGAVTFAVVVENVLRRYSELSVPPDPGVPPDPLPVIHDIDVEVQIQGAP